MRHLPTWLYHKTQAAKVFTTEESVKKALAEGWVDTPAKLEGVHEDLGQQTQTSDSQKPNETPTQPTSGENQVGTGSEGSETPAPTKGDEVTTTTPTQPAPINTADFATKTKSELISFLVEKGQDEKALKKLNKDQLIAKIGELGK